MTTRADLVQRIVDDLTAAIRNARHEASSRGSGDVRMIDVTFDKVPIASMEIVFAPSTYLVQLNRITEGTKLREVLSKNDLPLDVHSVYTVLSSVRGHLDAWRDEQADLRQRVVRARHSIDKPRSDALVRILATVPDGTVSRDDVQVVSDILIDAGWMDDRQKTICLRAWANARQVDDEPATAFRR